MVICVRSVQQTRGEWSAWQQVLWVSLVEAVSYGLTVRHKFILGLFLAPASCTQPQVHTHESMTMAGSGKLVICKPAAHVQ